MADTDAEFDGRTLRAPALPDPGYDWRDDLGRTCDAMGHGTASKDAKLTLFTRAIERHLWKSNDSTVIDVTGCTPDPIDGIKRYLDTLSPAHQAKIRTLGF